ncbi:hypothetical protein ACF0H5_005741 [Mactra antiquata]
MYGVAPAPSPSVKSLTVVWNDQNTTIYEDIQKINDEVNFFLSERIDLLLLFEISCEVGRQFIVDVSVPSNQSVLKIIGVSESNFTCIHYDDDNSNYQTNGTNVNFYKTPLLVYHELSMVLETTNIGVTSINFETFYSDLHDKNNLDPFSTGNNSDIGTSGLVNFDVIVIRDMHLVDIMFVVTVYVVEILEMITFGSQLDFDVVTHTLKKPVPLLIGLGCQYVAMPLIAFAIARAIASDSVTAIGIFVAGIGPGGGSSNIYSYLLDGDLSLSITMTTVSTVLSLGMMPLWLYTLGRIFLQAHELYIPYTDIIVALSVIIVPLSCGLFIRNKFPKIVTMVERVLSVVIIIAALALIVTGVISSLYLIKLFNLKIILVGCFLPYIGFLIGGLVALVFRQPFGNIKTIAIETGLQNTAIAMILLQNSFPPPYGDLATVAPVSAEVMSPIPPFLTSIVYVIYKKYCKKYKEVKETRGDLNFDDNDDFESSD